MIALVRAEFLRLFSRRLFRALAILVGGVMLFVAVVTFVTSTKDPKSGLEKARREVAACETQRIKAVEGGASGKDFQCPTLEDIRPSFDKRFRYAESMPDAARGVSAAMLIFALLIGASFVGAEWGTGSMTTLLTWEPRRVRVLLAKWCACIAVVAAFVVVALAFLTVLFYPVGALRGITAGVDGHWWKEISLTWLRGGALGAVGATIGIALATISRNTAGAAGVGFLYGAILDPLLGAILRGRFIVWTLHRNVEQFLGMPIEPTAADMQAGSGGSFIPKPHHYTAVRPAVLLTIYALAALSLAYAFFRSRDVT